MTITSAAASSSAFLVELANPAVRALAVAGCAGLVLAVFRVKSASLRLLTWTAVLYSALAMPLLAGVLPSLSVPAPAILPNDAAHLAQSQPRAAQPLVSARSRPEEVSSAAENSAERRSSTDANRLPPVSWPDPVQRVQASPTSHWPAISWSSAATAIYLAGALLLLARLAIGIVFTRRLMRAARRIRDSRLTLRLASRAYACGLASVPQAGESELISVPATMGVRSMILLPAGWREWDDAKLDAVVAHEVSHVARHDALTQRLSLLHRAIFWFSPLAWWLQRHLADLAEETSDEAALSCGTDRRDYARTLLGFFEALNAAPGRVWWQGVSMAKAGQAEQRVERILAWRGAVTMGLKKSVVVAILALAIPVVYLAASVRPAGPNLQAPGRVQTQTPAAANVPSPPPPTPSSEPGAPASPTAPAPVATAPVTPSAATAPVGIVGPIAPIPPMAAIQPVPPQAAHQAVRIGQGVGLGSGHGQGYSYAYSYDDEQRFVIVSGKTDSFTMSGTSEDARHAEKLKKKIPGDFIWFQRDEKSYIIRDQATIDRARKLWAPQEELGKRQEALGQQQEALGKQQEALSLKMEQIQVKVPDMTAELDKLRAQLKQLSAGATAEQIGDLQAEIGELQARIGAMQAQAGDQQSRLGEEMGALGEQQGKLGEMQGELGRQQGELAEQASRQMKEILDEAIKNGKAQPEPQTGDGASL